MVHSSCTFLKSGAYIGLALAIVGCGQSKEEKAVERMLHHKSPAYARLVNFGTDTFVYYNKGKILSSPIAPGDHSNFIISSPGEQKLEIKSGDKTVYQPKMTLQAGDCQTVLVTSQGAKVVTGEVRDAPPTQSSVRVFYIGGTKPVTVESGSDKIASALSPNSESAPVNVAPGDHSFKVTVDGSSPVEVAGNLSAADGFTVAVIEKAGKIEAKLINNSPQRKPSARGASAAG